MHNINGKNPIVHTTSHPIAPMPCIIIVYVAIYVHIIVHIDYKLYRCIH